MRGCSLNKLYKLLKRKAGKPKTTKAVFKARTTTNHILQALEPRILFDASTVADVHALLTDASSFQPTDADLAQAGHYSNDALNALVTEHLDSTHPAATLADPAGNDSPITGLLGDNPIVHYEQGNFFSHDKSLVKEVIFVDQDVSDYSTLIQGVDLHKLVSGELEIVMLKDNQSGISQITDYLKQYDHQIETVHIVSHGNQGELYLGSDVVNDASLEHFKADLSTWDNSFKADADILFYGCNVAEGAEGQKFVADLHSIINIDIAASSDITGSAALGGNWILEVNHGQITAQAAFSTTIQQQYQGILATVTVTNLLDNINGDTSSVANLIASNGGDGISLREAITATNNGISGADTINFAVSGTITIGSSLPTITQPLTIDGTTAPGYQIPATLPGDSSGPFDLNAFMTTYNTLTTRLANVPADLTPGSTTYTAGLTVKISASTYIFGTFFDFGTGSGGSIIKGLEIEKFGSSAIYLNPGTAGATQISVLDNYIHNRHSDGVGTEYGIHIITSNASSGHIIQNNIIHGGDAGIWNVAAGTQRISFNTISPIIAESTSVYIGIASTGNHSNIYFNTIDGLGVSNGTGISVTGNANLEIFSNVIHDFNSGVGISSGASNTGTYFNNTIYNVNKGIEVTSNNTRFMQNSIYNFTSIAIDIGANGVTANDTNDADTGVNALQNFPVITSASVSGSNIVISGTLNSVQTTDLYRIEVFGGVNGAEQFLGYSDITLTSNNGSFTITKPLTELPYFTGGTIYATATRIGVSAGTTYTSELSAGVALTGFTPAANVLTVSTTADTIDGTTTSVAALLANRGADGKISLREAITAANNTAGVTTIRFNVGGKITLGSALPNIIKPIVIDGSSVPGYLDIPIAPNNFDLSSYITTYNTQTLRADNLETYLTAGSNINSTSQRIHVTTAVGTIDLVTFDSESGGAVIKGLEFSNFGQSAINIIGTNNASNIIIQDNYIHDHNNNSGNPEYAINLFSATSGHIIKNNILSGGDIILNADNPSNSNLQISFNTLLGETAGGSTGALVNTSNTGYIYFNKINAGFVYTYGIHLAGTTNHEVFGNNVQGATYLVNVNNNASDGTRIHGNTLHDSSSAGYGIAIAGDNIKVTNNVIYNVNKGIVVTADTNDVSNTFSQNSISSLIGTTPIAIDLDGFGTTPNDANTDTDTGGNTLQNFPVLTTAVQAGKYMTITGTLGTADGTYTIEFFASSTNSPVLTDLYIGKTTVVVSGNTGSFSYTFDVNTIQQFPGTFITATATSSAGNTSEVSAAITATGYASSIIHVTTLSDVADSTSTTSFAALAANRGTDKLISLREAILASNATGTPTTIKFAVRGTLTLTSALPTITNTVVIDGTSAPGYIPPEGLPANFDLNTFVFNNPTETLRFNNLPGNLTPGSTINTANPYAVKITSNNYLTTYFEFGSNMSNSVIKGFEITQFGSKAFSLLVNINNNSGITIRDNYIHEGRPAVNNQVPINFAGASTKYIITNNIIEGGTTAIAGIYFNHFSNTGSQVSFNTIIAPNSTSYGIWSIATSSLYYFNEIIGYGSGFGANHDGINIYTSTNNSKTEIVGNDIHGWTNLIKTGASPVTLSSTFFYVYGNKLHDAGSSAVVNSHLQNFHVGGTGAYHANEIYNASNGVVFDSSTVAINGSIKNNIIYNITNDAISIRNNASNITISNNTIFSVAKGINIYSGNTNVVMSENLITSFSSMAIDLNNDGPTANDLNDTDTGANALLNYPVITSAQITGGNIAVTGTLNSGAGTYTIELFAGDNGPEVYLGKTTLTITGTTGSFSFSVPLAAFETLPSTNIIATATLAGTGTSEILASPTTISGYTPDSVVVDTINDLVDGNTASIAALLANKGADGKISLREAILAANNSIGTNTIKFNVKGTISLTSTLTITDTVIIDGTSAPGYLGSGSLPNNFDLSSFVGNNPTAAGRAANIPGNLAAGSTVDTTGPTVNLTSSSYLSSFLNFTSGSGQSVLKGLEMSNFGSSAITINTSQNGIVIEDNYIHGRNNQAGAEYAIQISGSGDDHVIKNNIIIGGDAAVFSTNSNLNSIADDNTGNKIYFNTIKADNIGATAGIQLGSPKTYLYYNTIDGSGVNTSGVNISNASGSEVVGNNISGNTIQFIFAPKP